MARDSVAKNLAAAHARKFFRLATMTEKTRDEVCVTTGSSREKTGMTGHESTHHRVREAPVRWQIDIALDNDSGFISALERLLCAQAFARRDAPRLLQRARAAARAGFLACRPRALPCSHVHRYFDRIHPATRAATMPCREGLLCHDSFRRQRQGRDDLQQPAAFGISEKLQRRNAQTGTTAFESKSEHRGARER